MPRKILIVDDERTIADSLAIILERNGFDTAAVYDSEEAVEKARTWEPEFLLTDVMMPGLSGIEAAIEICKMIPECRVFLISANAEFARLLLDTHWRGQNFQVLQKPIHPSELIAHLRSVA